MLAGPVGVDANFLPAALWLVNTPLSITAGPKPEVLRQAEEKNCYLLSLQLFFSCDSAL